MKYISETGRARELIIHRLEGYFGTLDGLNGIDIGFGGDPLLPNSICMDMPQKYTSNVIETSVQNLYGDCRDMYWFKDGCLDYVYSSHVLEDFLETEAILTEWARIVRPGGLLILNLPNEKKYRAVCQSRGYRSNPRHQILEMNPEYVLKYAHRINLEPIALVEDLPPDYYSFLLVLKKDKQCQI